MNPQELLEGQIRESYGRVLYTHKTHEKCADLLLGQLSRIKMWQIALSSITTGGFIATSLGAGTVGSTFGILFSTALLALNTYTKDYDIGELAQKHRSVAADLWLIREKHLSLLTDIQAKVIAVESAVKIRDELLSDLHRVYSGAPSTNEKGYKKAQEALQQNEEMTFSEVEINELLPSVLRKKNF